MNCPKCGKPESSTECVAGAALHGPSSGHTSNPYPIEAIHNDAVFFSEVAYRNLVPTLILAVDGQGALWQLWECRMTNTREWRRVPTLDNAMTEYGGVQT